MSLASLYSEMLLWKKRKSNDLNFSWIVCLCYCKKKKKCWPMKNIYPHWLKRIHMILSSIKGETFSRDWNFLPNGSTSNSAAVFKTKSRNKLFSPLCYQADDSFNSIQIDMFLFFSKWIFGELRPEKNYLIIFYL